MKPKRFNVPGIGVKVRRFGPRRDLEAELNAEIAAVGDKLAEQFRMDRELARTGQQFADEFDSEYWVCVVFQTREQKEAFLKLTGWGEKLDADKYLSGTKLAKLLGVTLPLGPKWRPAPAPKPRWMALALPLKR